MQKKHLRIFLFSAVLAISPVIAQTSKSQLKNNLSEEPQQKLSDKKTPRVRFDKLTFDNNGVAFYQNQPFSGEFFQVFDNSANPSKKLVLSKQGTMLNGLKHGEYFEFSKEGVRQLKETYINGTKNGPFEYYFEDNGAIEFQGQFLNGELDGEIKCFYKSGNTKYINHYSNGNRNGSCVAYFESGQIESEANFVNEIPDGDEIGYFKTGAVRHIKTFNMGVLNGRNYVFHKNNCPAIEEYYKNGKLDSIQRIFDNVTCNTITSGFWKDGQKHGTFVTFDMFSHFGDTLEIQNYDMGKRHGFSVVFKEKFDEKLQKNILMPDTYGNYVNESPDGLWHYGMVSNYQKRFGEYDLGVKMGEWSYFDIEGKLLCKQWYDQDGNLLKEKFFKK